MIDCGLVGGMACADSIFIRGASDAVHDDAAYHLPGARYQLSQTPG